jgi:hypothetical protein
MFSRLFSPARLLIICMLLYSIGCTAPSDPNAETAATPTANNSEIATYKTELLTEVRSQLSSQGLEASSIDQIVTSMTSASSEFGLIQSGQLDSMLRNMVKAGMQSIGKLESLKKNSELFGGVLIGFTTAFGRQIANRNDTNDAKLSLRAVMSSVVSNIGETGVNETNVSFALDQCASGIFDSIANGKSAVTDSALAAVEGMAIGMKDLAFSNNTAGVIIGIITKSAMKAVLTQNSNVESLQEFAASVVSSIGSNVVVSGMDIASIKQSAASGVSEALTQSKVPKEVAEKVAAKANESSGEISKDKEEELDDPNGSEDGVQEPDEKNETKICSPGELVESITCTESVADSVAATQAKKCDASGQGFVFDSCLVSSCKPTYILHNNSCIVKCIENENLGIDSCVSLIANSSNASRDKKCNSTGNGYVFGPCSLQGCNQGYVRIANECRFVTCEANSAQGSVSCVNDIAHSQTATKEKTCNSTGTDYTLGSCTLVACKAGYAAVNGSCVAHTCTPNQVLSSESCNAEIPNSIAALKSRTCNSQGLGYNYGNCLAQSCEQGFNLVDGTCVAQQCTPNATSNPVSCVAEIPGSTTANKSKTCNASGSDYIYGNCVATACSSSHTLSNGNCLSNDPAITAETGASNSQITVNIGPFIKSESVVTLYRFTSQPPEFWSCTTNCSVVREFKSENVNLSSGITYTDTLPAPGTTYWYRYTKKIGSTTTTVVKTASASSSASDIVYKHLAYLTNSSYKAGALGGLSGANTICSDGAASASLPGTNWRALLTTSNRLAWVSLGILGPIKDSRNVLVAGTENQFVYGRWENAIATASGTVGTESSVNFWLGTSAENCNNWSAADTANIGASHDVKYISLSNRRLASPTSTGGGVCNWTGSSIPTARLLCIGDLSN